MADYAKAIEFVLRHEGGYVNDPDDSGGETNYGITKKTAQTYGYFGSMKDLPKSLAVEIYKTGYWKCDKIRDQAVANKITDMVVNMGGGKVADIQGALNTYVGTHLVCDGVLGPLTAEAINNVNPVIMLGILADVSFAHYVRACIKKPSNVKYLNGGWWTRAQWRGE
jgi:lysozyme family protein